MLLRSVLLKNIYRFLTSGSPGQMIIFQQHRVFDLLVVYLLVLISKISEVSTLVLNSLQQATFMLVSKIYKKRIG